MPDSSAIAMELAKGQLTSPVSSFGLLGDIANVAKSVPQAIAPAANVAIKAYYEEAMAKGREGVYAKAKEAGIDDLTAKAIADTARDEDSTANAYKMLAQEAQRLEKENQSKELYGGMSTALAGAVPTGLQPVFNKINTPEGLQLGLEAAKILTPKEQRPELTRKEIITGMAANLASTAAEGFDFEKAQKGGDYATARTKLSNQIDKTIRPQLKAAGATEEEIEAYIKDGIEMALRGYTPENKPANVNVRVGSKMDEYDDRKATDAYISIIKPGGFGSTTNALRDLINSTSKIDEKKLSPAGKKYFGALTSTDRTLFQGIASMAFSKQDEAQMRDLRQKYSILKADIIRNQAGLSQTKSEMDRIDEKFDKGLFTSVDLFKQSMQNLLEKYKADTGEYYDMANSSSMAKKRGNIKLHPNDISLESILSAPPPTPIQPGKTVNEKYGVKNTNSNQKPMKKLGAF